MGSTIEQPTQQWAAPDNTTAQTPDELFRVVLDGIGPRAGEGSVASAPLDRATAQAMFDKAVRVFAAGINADELRVSVLAEHVWAQRTATGAAAAVDAGLTAVR